MAEISDYVPADGVRFDKAFERLFELDPRAAELRAKLDGGAAYDDAVDGWEAVRKDLRNGALDAYQRDPYTGEELKVSSKDWESAAILPGEELAFPPIYFLKSEFEAWLLTVSGRVSEQQTQER
jgi:hypothetical protein